jgi:hypothetical protein
MSKRLPGLVRIGFSLLVAAAIVWMVYTLVDLGTFNALNFFTFFTIMSNLLAAAVFFEGGRRQLTGQPPVSDMWRGAAVIYMTVTYLVFTVLLRDAQEDLQTHVPWVDSVLHRIMPIAVMFDWVIDPPRQPIGFRRALAWLWFPLVWLVFTMIRGTIDGRYPYPFLDPDEVGGYGVVALYVVAITLLLVFVIWLAARVGSAAQRRRQVNDMATQAEAPE